MEDDLRIQTVVGTSAAALKKFPNASVWWALFNPFVPNAPLFYPLKTSENHKVFWCFQVVEKGCIGNE